MGFIFCKNHTLAADIKVKMEKALGNCGRASWGSQCSCLDKKMKLDFRLEQCEAERTGQSARNVEANQ